MFGITRRRPVFVYHNHLDETVWNRDATMRAVVKNALNTMVGSYISYMHRAGLPITHDMISDILIHGSVADYYWDSTSDIDICIIMDWAPLREKFPDVDVYTLMKSLLLSWYRRYRIRIVGHGVDVEVADLNAPAHGENLWKIGSRYSLMHDAWIVRPNLLSPDAVRDIRRAALEKYREIEREYKNICRNKMSAGFVDAFLGRLWAERDVALHENTNSCVCPGAMAFRMARRTGILRDLFERAAQNRSRNFNVKY